MEAVIAKLSRLIFEEAGEEAIFCLEDLLKDSINAVVGIPDFFELPTENLLRIIKNSKIKDIEIIEKLVYNFSKHKEDEAPLILNVIDTDASLDEYIRVLSNLWTCPICRHIGEIIERDKILPNRDYESDIKELRQKIVQLEEEKSKLENENNKLKNKTIFPKVLSKPPDFEEDIFKASKDGKLTSVIYHIEILNTEVEAKDKIFKETPLSWASRKGHIEIVKYLVEDCHADFETKNNSGKTPLNFASNNGHKEVVKYLIEHCHADFSDNDIRELSEEEKDSICLLHKSSEKGDLSTIQKIISKDNFNINQKYNGNTALNNASRKGHIEIVKYLVEHCHADIDIKDNDGRTPLNLASINGHIEVVKFLAEHCHADVEIKDKYEMTPLSWASFNGHADVVKCLVEHCHAYVETKDKYGYTPLILASWKGHIEVVKYLVEHRHTNVETKDNRGETSLNWASRYGHIEVVKCLVEKGAKVSEKCIYDACSSGNYQNQEEIVKCLQEHK